MLTTKLINAINHQTLLDDSLSTTRHQLDTAKNKIKELDDQNANLRGMMLGDVWVRRSTLDYEKKTMQNEKKAVTLKLEEEKKKRLEVDREKRRIEQELENLTTALFEEANRMVVRAKEDAREEHLILQRKNDLLKAQLADTDSLLKSQQEQLFELKGLMETIASERDDQTNGTAPSSPAVAKFDIRDELGLPSADSTLSVTEGLSPAHPTSFHYLIQPVLRTDLACYDDFVTLARSSRKRQGSRVSSGSLGGFTSSLGLTAPALQSSASSASLSTAMTSSSAPQSPLTPASTASTSSAVVVSLRETRFYKRVLAEDVEPTLRLDIAPGLSWLARRTVINAMSEGTLVVEPIPVTGSLLSTAPSQSYPPCSLCGESRKDTPHLRTHRFRTSEAESAQRYPLCRYCHGRVRSTCDFLGFLRMVKDGHYRADDEDHEKSAWEESVRLREQMFWSRLGGGVVPVAEGLLATDMAKSRRASHARPEKQESVVQQQRPDEDAVKCLSPHLEDVSGEERSTMKELPHTPPEQTDRGLSTQESTCSTVVVDSEEAPESTKPPTIQVPE